MTELWVGAIIAIVLIVGAIVLYRFGCVKEAKMILLHLVSEAEERWGGGTGEIKFSEVACRLYEILPQAARYVLSTKTIASLIENAVAQMKAILTEK
ncbi:MAG: hypothetical protein IJW87_00055 [Clostridia bacterium]|nr:hypothetical protein [Clostridia bacterium]